VHSSGEHWLALDSHKATSAPTDCHPAPTKTAKITREVINVAAGIGDLRADSDACCSVRGRMRGLRVMLPAAGYDAAQ